MPRTPDVASYPDLLFREFAERLERDDLEESLAGALRREFPDLTAIVRIGGPERPPRVAGPRSGRGAAKRERGLLAVPIEHCGTTLGFLGYADDAPLRRVRAAAECWLLQVADAAAVPVRNALRHEEALRLAFKDPLTGLHNRRAFLDVLLREGQRALRHERPLALLLFDLDALKLINDTHGHAAGDAALCALATALEDNVRRADVVARIAGDEFAAVCPDTGLDAARRIAERVASALARREVGIGAREPLRRLSVSWGAAELAQVEGASIEAPDRLVTRMIDLADARLYRAKSARGAVRRPGRGPERAPGERR